MKRYFVPVIIGLGILTASGLTLVELTEYGTVARNRLQSTIQDSVPVDVELQRLEVLLDKVDTRTRDQKRIVAKAQIELQDAESLLAETRDRQSSIKQAMARVRDSEKVLVSTISGTRCGGSLSITKNDALARLLTSYKTQASTLAAREKAVAAHRHAVESLRSRFHDWSQERQTIRQQLDSLRARHAASQIASVEQPKLATDDLNRASALMGRIDRRLTIEELSSDELESNLMLPLDDFTTAPAVLDQVNAILENTADDGSET